ncbi:MAG: T9SS sorting signal type C domain-containing protein, partial [Bacteroidota bacterium]
LITFDGTTPVGSYNIGLSASSYFGTNNKTLVYTVSKLNQVVTLNPDPLPVKQVGDAPFFLEHSNTAGLPINWSSSQTGVATIDATGNITIVGPGTTIITAFNDGNELYNAVSVTRTLTVRQLLVTPSPIATLHAYHGQAQSNNTVQLTQITGANLTPANGTITVAASTGFIVSTNNQVSYGTTGTVAYTGGALDLTNPNIFVKLDSNLAIAQYTGTLTFTGGGATTVVNLSGTVDAAPSINTVASTYGSYCIGTTNTITVSYTTAGNFGTGSFYVQHSDATGVFPTDFSNIISNASAVSPISATMPAMLASGNYRVRVVHLSNAVVLTGSINDNGSNIGIIATPTLSSVTTSPACSGSNADIILNGLTANASFNINYTINGGTVQQVSVTTNATGTGSLAIPVTFANNGQEVVITSLTRNDVTAACTQTFSTNNSTAITIGGNTWTGAAANHDWNDASNWSCGSVPTLETPVSISPSASNPEIEDEIEVSSLTINNGGIVTVKTGATLTVQNALVNNNQIIVENNAALVQKTGSVYSGNGTAMVTRNSNPLFRLDYTMWGAPVAGQQLQAFSPNTISNRFYTYAYNWNAATNPGTYREQYFAENTANNFVPGKGYLVRMPDVVTGNTAYTDGTASHTFEGPFNGALNNGDIQVGITVTDLNTGSTLNQNGHYIAVANPYASPISVKEFFEQNVNVLDQGNGIYFWRKKNSGSESSYAHLTMLGFTANSAEGGDMGGNGGSFYYGNQPGGTDSFNAGWIISPAQGFLVKLKTGLADNATVNFNNSMRKPAPATGGQPFFKTMNNNDTPAVSRLWLNLTNSSNAYSQSMVGYLNEGTLGLDYGYDAKILGDGSAKLYSKAAENNLAIQARPVFEDTDVVPMGFAVTAAGQYTINLDHVDGLFSGSQNIYLKDNMTGISANLKEDAYTFTTDAGTFDSRFEVVYVTSQLGIDNPEISNNVVIYQEGKEIKIFSSLIMETVTVFDMLGRNIYTENGINATEFAKTLVMAQEVAIVKVTLQNGTTISKKVIIK